MYDEFVNDEMEIFCKEAAVLFKPMIRYSSEDPGKIHETE
jgi:hypothetical protein